MMGINSHHRLIVKFTRYDEIDGQHLKISRKNTINVQVI